MEKAFLVGSGELETRLQYETEIHECPICHSKIVPIKLSGYLKEDNFPDQVLYLMSTCPDSNCGGVFLIEYELRPVSMRKEAYYKKTYPNEYQKMEFDKIICSISPNFIEIYNQALQAESLELNEISGVAYRKALEFLIKDYCIKNKPDLKEEISGKLLGKVIANYIENYNIKECANRAAWLGNDETHYVKKWIDKDISDLKILIDLTVNWILTEEKTKQYLKSMPK